MATEQELNEYSNRLAQEDESLTRTEAELERASNEPIPERKFNSRLSAADQQKYVQRRESAREELQKLRERKRELRRERMKINEYREALQAQRQIENRQARGQERNALNRRESSHQWQTEYIYTNARGDPISIAPSIAESNIKNYNDWAAAQKSVAPDILMTGNFISAIKKPSVLNEANVEQWIKIYHERLPTGEQLRNRLVLTPAENMSNIEKAEHLRYKGIDQGLTNQKQSLKESALMLGAGFAVSTYSAFRGLINIPRLAYSIAKNPLKTIKGGIRGIRDYGMTFKDTLYYNPGFAAGEIAGYYVTGLGIGKVVSLPFEKKFYSNFKAIKFNLGQDVIRPVVLPNNLIQVGQFKIYSKVPKMVIYSDRPIKSWARALGIDNKYTGMKLERTYKEFTIDTFGRLITQNGRIVAGVSASRRRGFTLTSYNLLEGSQVQINIRKYLAGKENIPILQKYPLRKITKDVFLTSDNTAYFRGELRTIKGIRRSSYNKRMVFELLKQGKRENLFSTASVIKEVVSNEGRYTDYMTKLGLKDITKPNSRATGRITKIEGFSRVLEPKYLQGDISSFKIPKQGQIAKTSTLKSISGLQALKSISVKIVQKRTANLFSRRISRLTASEAWKGYPKMAGGLGLSTSIYYGQGQDINQENIVRPLSVEKSISVTKESVINKYGLKSVSVINEKNIAKASESTMLKPVSISLEKGLVKYQQKELQKPMTKTAQKSINKVGSRAIIPLQTFAPDRGLIVPRTSWGKKENVIKKTAFGFRTFVRSLGKIKWLPGVRERGAALRIGQSKVLATAAATFGVRKTNKPVSKTTNFIPSLKVFRSYRVQKGMKIPLNDVYIQRRGKRLVNPFEVADILSYKKRKKIRL